MTSTDIGDIVTFLRKRDYIVVKELGKGACGRTVLLHDDLIDEDFVCKKFSPFSEDHRQVLYGNFVRETKILHELSHDNVVRVFNYYLYPDEYTGYILMEYVEGHDIEDHIAKYPELINELFLQAVSGFRYLEAHSVLHRDIRPQNLMVRRDGILKIIDFGFGKMVQESKDFDKSVSLNLWCPPPKEFETAVYDFTTEVYFVGKLFERLIQQNHIEHFEHKGILSQMCESDPINRVASFAEIDRSMQNRMFLEIPFTDDEIGVYRTFAKNIEKHLSKIETQAKYVTDIDRVQSDLEDAYRSFLLEEFVPDCAPVLRCFVNGNYYYRKVGLPVAVVKSFLHLFKSSPPEMKRMLLANLYTRLSAVIRYDKSKPEDDDDLPF